jgi:hypothetical protein
VIHLSTATLILQKLTNVRQRPNYFFTCESFQVGMEISQPNGLAFHLRGKGRARLRKRPGRSAQLTTI